MEGRWVIEGGTVRKDVVVKQGDLEGGRPFEESESS